METAFEKLASAFVNGYNARDPEAWARIFHPDCEYHPTVLVGSRGVYAGRDEIREYIRELQDNDRGQQAAWTEVRACSDARFVMCGEVLIDGELVTEATVIFELKGWADHPGQGVPDRRRNARATRPAAR